MSSLLRLLAHPARREIVRALAEGELCVSDLQERLGQRQAYVSQQLAYLRDANLVRCREKGVHCYYALADPTRGAVVNAIDRMCSALEEAPEGCTFLVQGSASLPHLITALHVLEEGLPCRVADLVAYAARPTARAGESANVVAAFGMSGHERRSRRGCAKVIVGRLRDHGYETIQTCRRCPHRAAATTQQHTT